MPIKWSPEDSSIMNTNINHFPPILLSFTFISVNTIMIPLNSAYESKLAPVAKLLICTGPSSGIWQVWQQCKVGNNDGGALWLTSVDPEHLQLSETQTTDQRKVGLRWLHILKQNQLLLYNVNFTTAVCVMKNFNEKLLKIVRCSKEYFTGAILRNNYLINKLHCLNTISVVFSFP